MISGLSYAKMKCFGLLFVVLSVCDCSLKYEKILHRKLRENYIRDVRPESGHEEPVKIEYDMILASLNSLRKANTDSQSRTSSALTELTILDPQFLNHVFLIRLCAKDNVKTQILEINSIVTMSWYDPQLKWNISDYNNIQNITIGTEYLWTPDIVLYNNADDRKYFHTQIYTTKILVQNDGNVVWNAPVTWKISCSCDVTWFPFDEQVCAMEFGSWTYSRSQIILALKPGSNEQEHFLGGKYLISNGEWKINLVKMHESMEEFHCCPEPFSTIRYELHMSRMSLYYILYILLPLFSLVLLFLLVFHLEDGERMGFGITVLLSITVYLLVISEYLPEKSDTYPMVGVCFVIEFYFLCVGLAIAAFNIRLSKRTKNRPPRFIVRITNWYNNLSFPTRKTERKEHELIPMAEDQNGNTEVSKSKVNGKIEEEKSIEDEWYDVSRFSDKCFTLIFFIISIITPMIVSSALSGQGEEEA